MGRKAHAFYFVYVIIGDEKMMRTGAHLGPKAQRCIVKPLIFGDY